MYIIYELYEGNLLRHLSFSIMFHVLFEFEARNWENSGFFQVPQLIYRGELRILVSPTAYIVGESCNFFKSYNLWTISSNMTSSDIFLNMTSQGKESMWYSLILNCGGSPGFKKDMKHVENNKKLQKPRTRETKTTTVDKDNDISSTSFGRS